MRRGFGSALAGAALAAIAAGSATQMIAQLPVVDLSGRDVETVIPAEFEGGFFGGIADIVPRDDAIWVLDAREGRVLHFDDTGRLIGAFGRQGNGPGEFSIFVNDLRVDSVVSVTDMRQQRVSRFTLGGEHLETRRAGGAANNGTAVPSGGLAFLRNGAVVKETRGFYTFRAGGIVAGDPYHHLILESPAGNRTDTIASWRFDSVSWVAGPMSMFSSDFGDAGAWAAMGDSAVVVANGYNGAITVFTAPRSPGQETATAWLSVDSVAMGVMGRPASAADRERAEADFRSEQPNLPRRVTFGDWPTHWSVATSLLISEDGKVWARRAVYGDERQHWTEVDLHGSLGRHFILPERFSLRAIADGKLYGVARDEMDVQRVAAQAFN